ncbi:hypothetical protein IDH20_03775 [Pelagibacterales bacterium SAG-MED39]|nr:hypothetical protein [Pelagibacterales bacterium SAG-MED39]
MKILIYRVFIIFFIILTISIVYLSTIGIETNRFNNQISDELKKINKNLIIELKKIKIVLNPLELKLKIKTYGIKVKNKDKIIELDNIQSKISINSYFENKFILTDLNISTKAIEIKNLISFVRTFRNDPKLYIIKKLIKKGYLIADIKLEFDSNGKLKNNYSIKGMVRESKIDFFNRYNLSNINFLFNISDKVFNFQDIGVSLNNTKLLSKKIDIKKIRDDFFY